MRAWVLMVGASWEQGGGMVWLIDVPVLHVCVRWTGHGVVGGCMMSGCWVLWGNGDSFLNHTAVVVVRVGDDDETRRCSGVPLCRLTLIRCRASPLCCLLSSNPCSTSVGGDVGTASKRRGRLGPRNDCLVPPSGAPKAPLWCWYLCGGLKCNC